MTEADEKRLAIIRKAIADGPGYAGACEPDRAFLLRLLDERAAEMERLERSVTRAEAELRRLSFASGNVALDHPDWPPEYARHLAALVARAEAAERRVAELEEVLRGFEGIGFKPCKDPACYRATLTMMQQAHTALTHTDEASDDRPRADQERYGGGF